MSLNGLNIFLADMAGATTTQPNPTGQMIQTISMMVIMGIIFYVLLIRPQSKKAKELEAMIKAMKPGDKVVTNGGIVGTIVSVKDKTVSIRSADTKLEVVKSAISQITERAGESSASES